MTSPARRAVLFDLDGTLLDTLDDLADSMNAVLAAEGLPGHPADAYRIFVGDGVVNLVKRALPAERQEAALVERCTAAMREQYERRWAAKTRPYPGIAELLEDLGRRGVAMAVLSNKPHEFTVRIVRHFFATVPFAAVFGAREGIPRKPDPAAVHEIMRLLGVAADGTLYVGDSSTDMDTARAAGLTAVGVLWGFRGSEELLAHGARHLIEHPRELLRLFASGA